jgi:unsaturated rhamnogalacturonyl hydrolase
VSLVSLVGSALGAPIRALSRVLAGLVFVLVLAGLPAAAATDWGRAMVEATIARHPDPATLSGWNYPFGLYLHGQYLVFRRTGEARYLRYIEGWPDSHIDAHDQIDRPLDTLDSHMPGLLLLDLYRETGEPKYARAAQSVRRSLDGHPRTNDGGYWHTAQLAGQLWADGTFMVVPFLVEYGRIFPDRSESTDEAVRQLLIYARHLQDPRTGLLWHAYDETGRAPWLPPGTSHSPEFWCRAVGWYGLALIHALDGVEEHPRRPDLLSILQRLVAGLERYQDRDSGLWFQVMDKGEMPGNWTETSCSAMHTYVISRAVERGYVPARYAAAAARGYQGVLSRVSLDAEGRTDLDGTCVGTGVGDLASYLARPRLRNDLHGLGAFLLMYEQVRDRL